MDDAHLMSLQSSHQDSSLGDEKAKTEDRPSSSRLSTRLETMQTKVDLAMMYPNLDKYTITVSGTLLRTPSTSSILPEHMTTDYDSGRQALLPQLKTILCRQIAPTEWFLKQGNELYSRDSRRLVPHRRLYLRVLGSRSSSNKTPMWVRLLAPGNWCGEWKESREEIKATRQMTQSHPAPGNWSGEMSQLLRKSLNLKSTSELKELHKM